MDPRTQVEEGEWFFLYFTSSQWGTFVPYIGHLAVSDKSQLGLGGAVARSG